MTFDEAYSECIAGARMRHDGMQPGCYIEHTFSRGVLKCWPVDCPSLEWQRSSCDFVPTDADREATWHELTKPMFDQWGKPIVRPVEIPASELGEVKPQRSKWGQTNSDAALIAIQQQRDKEAKNDLGFTLDPTKQVELTSEERIARIDHLLARHPDGAPKRDSWGRPIA